MGKSIATSSANQSPRPDPVRLDAGRIARRHATAPPRVGKDLVGVGGFEECKRAVVP